MCTCMHACTYVCMYVCMYVLYQSLPVGMMATLLVFNHLARHNSQIATPTRDRLKNPAVEDQCNAIIDLIFWQGHMYDCQVNRDGCDELVRVLSAEWWSSISQASLFCHKFPSNFTHGDGAVGTNEIDWSQQCVSLFNDHYIHDSCGLYTVDWTQELLILQPSCNCEWFSSPHLQPHSGCAIVVIQGFFYSRLYISSHSPCTKWDSAQELGFSVNTW